jgi:thymidylate synthase
MFNIIAARDDVWGIGKAGGIPWSRTETGREDLRHFRDLTINSVVIMGRITYESLGAPLSNRLNIVLSQDLPTQQTIQNMVVLTARSLDEALEIARREIAESQGRGISATTLNGKIWVIGGARLYAAALSHPKLAYAVITHISGNWECDVFMQAVRMQVIEIMAHNGLQITYYGNSDERTFLKLLKKCSLAPARPNRTGVPTYGLFAKKLEFSLMRGDAPIIPLLTTKRVPFKMIKSELLWFISGKCTDTSRLHEDGCHIWDDNTTREFLDSRGLTQYEVGECGPIYGYQWRCWNRPYSHSDGGSDTIGNSGIDQLANVIKTLRTDPFDRRMIVSAWNPEQIGQMALPPCHWSFQFHCELTDQNPGVFDSSSSNTAQPYYTLNCLLNMRSADLALGVPFNIASYSLLTHMVARCVNMRPGKLVIIMADCHVYETHLEGLREQIVRTPGQFPVVKFRDDIREIDQFTSVDQIVLEGYDPHPAIKYPMAI